MTDFLAFLNSGVVMAVNIIKWASVVFLTFHIAVLGFDIMNNGKDSTDVLTKVKSKMVPLAVGFFLVIACSTLQSTIKGFIDDINTNKGSAPGTDKVTGADIKEDFSWTTSSSSSSTTTP